jgi:hypothetical protein
MLRDGLRTGHRSAPVDRVIVGLARGAENATDLRIVGEVVRVGHCVSAEIHYSAFAVEDESRIRHFVPLRFLRPAEATGETGRATQGTSRSPSP